jgi:DNA gyrase subunit A
LKLEHLTTQVAQLLARAKGAFPGYAGLSFDYVARGFSEEQATSILEMRLQRLTGMQKEELFKEMIELCKTVACLEDILGNESSLLKVIKAELLEVRERYADARRTEIIAQAGELSTEDLIADEPMVVTLSHAGYIKRTSLSEYRAQRRGGRGKMGATTKEDDFISDVFVASTHSFLMPITTRGKLYWLKVHSLPLASRASRGKPIVNFLQLAEGEKLAQVLVAREFSDNLFVLFVSRKGTVKRTDLSAFSNVRSSGIIALGIEEGDGLVAVKLTDGTKDVLLSTAQGLSIRFSETDVRSMGRVAYGVKGITLAEGDEVVGAEVVEKGASLLTVTERGFGKRTEESEYRTQGRGGKGIIDIKTTVRNGQVVGLIQVKDEDEMMLMTNAGTLIRMAAKEISVIGRNTQGVRLIALENEEEKVVGVSRLPEIAEEAGGEGAEGDDVSEDAHTEHVDGAEAADTSSTNETEGASV